MNVPQYESVALCPVNRDSCCSQVWAEMKIFCISWLAMQQPRIVSKEKWEGEGNNQGLAEPSTIAEGRAVILLLSSPGFLAAAHHRTWHGPHGDCEPEESAHSSVPGWVCCRSDEASHFRGRFHSLFASKPWIQILIIPL